MSVLQAEHTVWHVVRAAVIAAGLCGMVWLSSGCGAHGEVSAGDTAVCTLLGTTDGLMVDFEASAPGDYALAFDGDGVRGECAVAVDESLQLGALRCAAELGLLTPRGQRLLVLNDDGDGPAEFELTLRAGEQGQVVWTQPVRPSYVLIEPNGPGCGEDAVAQLTVPLGPAAP